MEYRFAEKKDYTHFASGRVFYHHGGGVNFPVRLGEEIFLRCCDLSAKKQNLTVYDPCCGSAYLLTTIALLHSDKIENLYASDVNEQMINAARKNLSLLTSEGFEARQKQLEQLLKEHGRESHREALGSLEHLRPMQQKSQKINTGLFNQNLFNSQKERSFKADIIIVDLPYSQKTEWSGSQNSGSVLSALKPFIHSQTIISLIHDKYQKIGDPEFRRIKKEKSGKRVIQFFSPQCNV